MDSPPPLLAPPHLNFPVVRGTADTSPDEETPEAGTLREQRLCHISFSCHLLRTLSLSKDLSIQGTRPRTGKAAQRWSTWLAHTEPWGHLQYWKSSARAERPGCSSVVECLPGMPRPPPNSPRKLGVMMYTCNLNICELKWEKEEFKVSLSYKASLRPGQALRKKGRKEGRAGWRERSLIRIHAFSEYWCAC